MVGGEGGGGRLDERWKPSEFYVSLDPSPLSIIEKFVRRSTTELTNPKCMAGFSRNNWFAFILLSLLFLHSQGGSQAFP